MTNDFNWGDPTDIRRILIATFFGCAVIVYALYAFLPGVK